MKITVNCIILYLIFISSSLTFAQENQKIFNKETPVTWLGIDFTAAKYIGNPLGESARGMKLLYPKINYLIVTEAGKYNIAKCFYKSKVINNLLPVENHNRGIDTTTILSTNKDDYTRLNKEMIQTIVNEFDMGETKGVGLVFIMEGMNQLIDEAAMWVTFIDSESKNVLFTTRLTGAGSGVGFRNNWAGSVGNVLGKVYSKEYKNWQGGTSGKK